MMLFEGIVERSYGAAPRFVDDVLMQHYADVRLADGRVFMPYTPKRLAAGARVLVLVGEACKLIRVLP